MKGIKRSRKKSYKTHRGQFETLKMNEEESIAANFLHVDEIFNTIKGFCEESDETIIVKKVFRTLPSRFNLKIYAIE